MNQGMRVHELKANRESFYAIKRGEKLAELRLNDRGYEVGDLLLLRLIDDDAKIVPGQAGEFAIVTHVLAGGQYGLDGDWVMLSIRRATFVLTPDDTARLRILQEARQAEEGQKSLDTQKAGQP